VTALFWEIIDNMTFLAFCLAGMTMAYFIGKIIDDHDEFMRFCGFAKEAAAIIDAQPVPLDCYTPHCVACGDRLDDQAMEYCYDSDNGFHVRPHIADL
jgi:hypothetical protein